MLGKGRAEAIGDRDIALLADDMGVHPADLEAIAKVESRGFGWFKDGRMKILFEKHWFHKHLSGANRNKAVRLGLARKNWISPKRGGYKEQSSPGARYNLLKAAIEIDEEAAYRSISMGKFQIMGFNHGTCGFVSAKHMFVQFVDTEVQQLRAFANFLRENNLTSAIRNRDFETVEEVYNGGGLGGAYARRMKKASDALRAGKWKDYQPGQFARVPELSPEPARVPVPEPRPEAKPIPRDVEDVVRDVAAEDRVSTTEVGGGLLGAGGVIGVAKEAVDVARDARGVFDGIDGQTLLTVLPWAAVAGLGFWIWRERRRHKKKARAAAKAAM
ncbi:N-acetylmuramidase domain-containing protein [Hoeflea sp.]|uniref:N-acetylmuramidase domain-containing protein n=1 Tax=Hoeflea sp. TaxID=1940281 RepID=UPI003B52CE7B